MKIVLIRQGFRGRYCFWISAFFISWQLSMDRFPNIVFYVWQCIR